MTAKPEYIRFVGASAIGGMAARGGFLTLAYAARGNPDLDGSAATEITNLINWFKLNLAVPPRFSRTMSKSKPQRQTKGICWFKASAKEHVDRAIELKLLLNDLGHPIEMIRETQIGYIVWEDAHQVVAEPFADTKV